ncbi:13S globulin seed storage protein 1 [Euphorbia peplus]|nr:13S globulin seed storage protein 1 [Euphorbia peplus]
MANYLSMLSGSLRSLLFLLLVLHSFLAMGSETNCTTIPNLIDREPDTSFPGEAGSIDVWNLNCARLYVVRFTIKPNGHLVPTYTNAYEFSYFIQGKLTVGRIIPRCSQKSDGEKNECQKIYQYEKGDVTATRAGEIIWSYNGGNETVIVISIYRVTNIDTLRVFSLGGSQKILNGFSSDFISNAFNIDVELAMKLQVEDRRGIIIYISSEIDLPNVITDESFDNNNNTRIAKLSGPSKKDLFIPKVGYFATVDAREFPILELIKFSASYNLLLKDVMRLPHWENSYRIICVLKGEGQIQVAGDNGKNVFNKVIKEGQILLVPKYFVMAEQAKKKIFEYVIFKTIANPISYDISGRNSVMYGLPLEVLTNAFQITEAEAKKTKFGRNEITLAKI